MSTHGNPQTSCEGKIQYTHRAARLVLKLGTVEGLTMYSCPYCHWWHIGNQLGDTNKRPIEKPKRLNPNEVRHLLDDSDE